MPTVDLYLAAQTHHSAALASNADDQQTSERTHFSHRVRSDQRGATVGKRCRPAGTTSESEDLQHVAPYPYSCKLVCALAANCNVLHCSMTADSVLFVVRCQTEPSSVSMACSGPTLFLLHAIELLGRPDA